MNIAKLTATVIISIGIVGASNATIGTGSLNTNSNNGVNAPAATKVNSDNVNDVTNHNHNYHGGSTVVQGGGTQKTEIDTNQVTPATVSNITTSGADTCFGSATGGVSLPGLGAIAAGSTYKDENCEMIKQVKLLAQLGLKDAAVCHAYNSDEDIAKAINLAYPKLKELCVEKVEEDNTTEVKSSKPKLKDGYWIDAKGQTCSMKTFPIVGEIKVCN